MHRDGAALRRARMFASLLLAGCAHSDAQGDTPLSDTRYVSHENAGFNSVGQGMKAGLDKKLYLWGGPYVMRINPDGTDKAGTDTTDPGDPALTGITANAQGTMAISVAHFASRVVVTRPDFTQIGFAGGFFNGDTRYGSPDDVTVGSPSGNFYAIDQYRTQIVEVDSKTAIQKNVYPITSGAKQNATVAIGVCEAASLFVLHDQYNNFSAVSFDNTLKWTKQGIGAAMGQTGGGSSWHVDPTSCAIYVMSPDNLNITIIDGKTGTITGNVTLQWEMDVKKQKPIIWSVAVIDTTIYVKIQHPTELFRKFSMTGQLLGSVRANVDQVTMTVQGLPNQGLPSNKVVEPGSTVNLNVDFTLGDPHGTADPPVFSAWIRRYHSPEFTRLDWSREESPNIQVPKSTGLYQIRVTPGLRATGSLYQVDTLVEVRAARDIVGTVSVFSGGQQPITSPGYQPSTLGRYYYSQGEAMNFTARLRYNWTLTNSTPAALEMQIVDNSDQEGAQPLSLNATLSLVDQTATWIIPASTTAKLAEGRYLVTLAPAFAIAHNLSVIPHPFRLGRAFEKPAFKVNQYGDYGPGWSVPETPPGLAPVYTMAEAVEQDLRRSTKLGVNMYVDRSQGGQTDFNVLYPTNPGNDPTVIQMRAAKDNLSIAQEVLYQQGVDLRTMTGRAGIGIEQRLILGGMDMDLPVCNTGMACKCGGYGCIDPETGAQFGARIAQATSNAMQSPAFTGWSWAANWWMNAAQTGCNALANPPGKCSGDPLVCQPGVPNPAASAACKVAMDAAMQNGTWSPLFDQAAAIWTAYLPDAERQFRGNLTKIMPGGLSCMTGPYRSVNVNPAVAFADADEVDLQYQSEQIQPPQTSAHNVEFQGRPGKPKFAHYELMNDDGTGQFMQNDQWQMLMRGVGTGGGGVGWSGGFTNSMDNDVRDGVNGQVGSFRAFNTAILRDYGPWLAKLNKTDDVCLVVSTRMMNIDPGGKMGGQYFDQLWEAWNALFYAGMPASFCFTEDLPRYGAAGLSGFKAVIVVGQKVPLDAALQTALSHAVASKVWVGSDQSTFTAATMPAGSHVLPWSFNYTDSPEAGSVWQDDSAYQRFQDYWVNAAAALRPVLMPVVKPVTDSGNPQVLMSTLHPIAQSTPGRFIFAVNNQLLGLSPGIVWRVTDIMAQRIPQVACVQLGQQASEVVYDVFAHKIATVSGNCTSADLRNLQGRIFAVLPAKITGVAVTAALQDGILKMTATVQGSTTEVPAKISITSSDGRQVFEKSISVGPTGWSGTFATGVNEKSGSQFEVAVAELFSGIVGSATAASDFSVQATQHTPRSQNVSAHVAPELSFGMHFKSVVASADGSTLVLNAFNMDQNLFGMDATDGTVTWRKRLGHYWSYAPTVATDGVSFLAQAFDLNNANGMQLYSGIDQQTGIAKRRFSLPAYPDRGTSWSGAEYLSEPYNYAFASGSGWAAASGDLAIAVWDVATGAVLWTQEWFKSTRQYLFVTAMGPDTLVIFDPGLLNVTAVSGKTGATAWTLNPTLSGSLLGATASADGSTLAVWGTYSFAYELNGAGTTGIFIISHNGTLLHTIGMVASEVSLSADGSALAATSFGVLAASKSAKTLSVFSITSAKNRLLWSYHATEVIRNPTFNLVSKQVAFGTDLGEMFVADVRSGAMLLEEDLGSSCAFAFLPSGILIVASWMGRVTAFEPGVSASGAGSYAEKWSTVVRSTGGDPGTEPRQDLMKNLLDPETNTPTAHLDVSNAVATPLTNNLLTTAGAIIYMEHLPTPAWTDPVIWNHPVERMIDGNLTAPGPWLTWSTLESIDSGWNGDLVFVVDGFRTLFEIDAVAFVEDSATPSSWLHDMKLEWWNKTAAAWQFHQYLTSNSATHVHTLDVPLTATKIRLSKANPTATSAWPRGNLLLAEFGFLGKSLGCSAPDVQAKLPVAVLYDEDPSDIKAAFKTACSLAPHCVYNYCCFNMPFDIVMGSAVTYSGDQAIGMVSKTDPLAGDETEDTTFPASAPIMMASRGGINGTGFEPPGCTPDRCPGKGMPPTQFGAAIPNFCFEVVETPSPGQYRWLQFAWRGMDGNTTGIAFWIGEDGNKTMVGFVAGNVDPTPPPVEATRVKLGAASATWTVVRQDLWQIASTAGMLNQSNGTLHVTTTAFGSVGGGGNFDQILLCATEADCANTKPLPH